MLSALRRRCASSLPSPSAAAPHAWIVLEYVFKARDTSELLAARAPFRAAHLAHVAAAPSVALGGALGPPVGSISDIGGGGSGGSGSLGGLILFRGGDSAEAVRFAENDPYYKAGLVARYYVRPWTVVIER